MSSFKVVFYKDLRGREPAREFIELQDKATQSKFTKLFDLLQIYGPKLMMPYARHLQNGIYELRIRGKNEVRIFYVCLTQKQTAVLLHGFKKRTQKTPAKELKVAQSRQKGLTTL